MTALLLGELDLKVQERLRSKGESQIEFGTVRRCRLTSPYLEHLAVRFAAYLSRVPPRLIITRSESDLSLICFGMAVTPYISHMFQ